MTLEAAYEHVCARRKIANLRKMGGVSAQWRALVAWDRELRRG